jgi:hypothetical protein
MKNNQLFEFNLKPDKKHILEIGKHKIEKSNKKLLQIIFQ